MSLTPRIRLSAKEPCQRRSRWVGWLQQGDKRAFGNPPPSAAAAVAAAATTVRVISRVSLLLLGKVLIVIAVFSSIRFVGHPRLYVTSDLPLPLPRRQRTACVYLPLLSRPNPARRALRTRRRPVARARHDEVGVDSPCAFRGGSRARVPARPSRSPHHVRAAGAQGLQGVLAGKRPVEAGSATVARRSDVAVGFRRPTVAPAAHHHSPFPSHVREERLIYLPLPPGLQPLPPSAQMGGTGRLRPVQRDGKVSQRQPDRCAVRHHRRRCIRGVQKAGEL